MLQITLLFFHFSTFSQENPIRLQTTPTHNCRCNKPPRKNGSTEHSWLSCSYMLMPCGTFEGTCPRCDFLKPTRLKHHCHVHHLNPTTTLNSNYSLGDVMIRDVHCFNPTFLLTFALHLKWDLWENCQQKIPLFWPWKKKRQIPKRCIQGSNVFQPVVVSPLRSRAVKVVSGNL